jgi:hypothetical protein
MRVGAIFNWRGYAEGQSALMHNLAADQCQLYDTLHSRFVEGRILATRMQLRALTELRLQY